MARFRGGGFNPELKYALNLIKADNLEDLVNTALNEENGCKVFEESRKHSRDGASSSSSNAITPAQKHQIWVPNSALARATYVRSSPRLAQRPPNPAIATRSFVPQPRPTNTRPPVTCYKCGQEGHISPNCTQSRLLPSQPRPTSTQAMARAPPRPTST